MKYFDTHCHLDFPDFSGDLDAVVERARRAGVTGLLTIGASLESSRAAVRLAQTYPEVHAAVGIHPNHTAEASPGDLDAIEELAQDPNVKAVGETGLDFFRDAAPRAVQEAFFRRQLEIASRAGKPVILHSRESGSAVMDLVEEAMRLRPVKGVLHCFTGDEETLSRALRAGLSIGLSGILTFPRGGNVRALARRIPDAHILLDSDSPFLAPEPHRGKRNEPAYVALIARRLAEIRGVSEADVARITTQNAEELLSLADEDEAAGRIAYVIRNTLYLALTNECTNDCSFCARNRSWRVKGHDIRLARDPDAAEVIAAMGDVSSYDEVCFCGFGEPTVRLEVVKAVADELHRRGKRVRLDTNGLGNLQHGRNIVPELVGRIDAVSVSLNTADSAQYLALCRPRFGEGSYEAVCDFVR
ncbi:MAG: TatD family hydrolase, partial [Planctomycetota bacterium]